MSSETKTVLLEKINDAIRALEAQDTETALKSLKAVGQKGRSTKGGSGSNGAPKEKRPPSEFNNFIRKKMDELKREGVGKDVRERLSMSSQAWNEYKEKNGIVTQSKKSKKPTAPQESTSAPLEKEEYAKDSESEEQDNENEPDQE